MIDSNHHMKSSTESETAGSAMVAGGGLTTLPPTQAETVADRKVRQIAGGGYLGPGPGGPVKSEAVSQKITEGTKGGRASLPSLASVELARRLARLGGPDRAFWMALQVANDMAEDGDWERATVALDVAFHEARVRRLDAKAGPDGVVSSHR